MVNSRQVVSLLRSRIGIGDSAVAVVAATTEAVDDKTENYE
jgi:hypothetical protein